MSIGARVYGLAAVLLGVQGLVFASFGAMGMAVPPHIPGYQALAYAAAALLIASGLALNARPTARFGSLALAALFGLIVLAAIVPAVARQPMVWVSWENFAEGTVKALGGVLAFILVSSGDEARSERTFRIARPLFGLCLMVFGTSEFVYSAFTADFVPRWIPPSGLFWAYVTGAAQIAAGLAVLSGIQARLAARLLTLMYLIFQLIVHVPRVMADPSAIGAWAEFGTNLVLAGAAWALVDVLGRGRQAVSTAPEAA